MTDPAKTTLYNHKAVGDGLKPLITNIVFKQLLDAIESGNSNFVNEVFSQYELTEDQKILAQYKIDKRKL